ncbi:MAG: hypothetical protein ACJ72D_10460 [Marmoricola sp.]
MRPALGLALVVVLGVAGCGHDAPVAEKPSDPSATSSRSALPSPMTFTGCGDLCMGNTGTFLDVTTLELPYRDLTLTDAALVSGSNVTLEHVWVAPLPPQNNAVLGMYSGRVPERSDQRDDNWAHRVSASGAQLSSGTTYAVFARLRVLPGAHWNGIELGWYDGKQSGKATWAEKVHAEKQC